MALPPEPPAEPPPPPPPSPDMEGGECPRCGTPYEPFQEYCLECGLRLPVARGIIPVLATAWRRRIPWYPGDWIWPVLLSLVISALAAAIAILATRDHETSATKTRAQTGESVPVGSGTGPGQTEPGGSGTLPTTAPGTSTGPAVPPPPPTSGGLTEWPPGQNGWTIVLASMPQSSGRAAAVRQARKAISAGVSEVGVLNSSEYSSLHSGYYVVFSGVYNSLSEAKSALGTVQSSYPQAYTRQVTQ